MMYMQNNLLNSASRLLGSLHMTGAMHELNQARVPIGLATTVAGAIEGNPRAARSVIGSVAREYDSPVLNTALRFGGMGAMMSMFQSIGPMLSGLFGRAGGIFGGLENSGGLAMMGNVPGNPLARSFASMGGLDPSRMTMLSVDPVSGVTSRVGVPAINAPAAAPVQQNVLGAVPGLSAPTPPGMG